MNSFEAMSKVASWMVQNCRNLVTSQLARKPKKCQQMGAKKKKKGKKTKEIISGEGSGTTPKSLSPSSDVAIEFVTASSARTSDITKSSTSVKKKESSGSKNLHKRKEIEREKGKSYHHRWSLLLSSSFPKARQHSLRPPQ